MKFRSKDSSHTRCLSSKLRDFKSRDYEIKGTCHLCSKTNEVIFVMGIKSLFKDKLREPPSYSRS